MEGLIFFIAMIVFVVRTVNKLKKTASGKNNTAVPRSTPAKGKLEELIRKMEEAEKIRNEEAGPSADDDFSDTSFAEEELRSFDKNLQESSDISGSVSSRSNSVKYENKDSAGLEVSDDDSKVLPSRKNKTSEKSKYKSAAIPESIYSSAGKKNDRSSKDSSGILSSLSKYPDLKKAVILKEILDSPVSEKY